MLQKTTENNVSIPHILFEKYRYISDVPRILALFRCKYDHCLCITMYNSMLYGYNHAYFSTSIKDFQASGETM